MADDPTKPEVGALKLDLSDMAPDLVDLAPGAMRGIKREHKGFPAVMKEITGNQEAFGKRAGISTEDVEKLLALTAIIARIREARPAVAKLSEILLESEAYYEDQRESLLNVLGISVVRRATLDGEEELEA